MCNGFFQLYLVLQQIHSDNRRVVKYRWEYASLTAGRMNLKEVFLKKIIKRLINKLSIMNVEAEFQVRLVHCHIKLGQFNVEPRQSDFS